MQAYLKPVVESVATVVNDCGVDALYNRVWKSPLDALFQYNGNKKSTVYEHDLLLQHWELKEILCSEELYMELERIKKDYASLK